MATTTTGGGSGLPDDPYAGLAADDAEFTEIPAYDTGGRVEHTGIALVHEGEWIVPAAGSEAVVARRAEPPAVVHYHFPVEVEVVGALRDQDVRRVADHVFAELDRELGSRG